MSSFWTNYAFTRHLISSVNLSFKCLLHLRNLANSKPPIFWITWRADRAVITYTRMQVWQPSPRICRATRRQTYSLHCWAISLRLPSTLAHHIFSIVWPLCKIYTVVKRTTNTPIWTSTSRTTRSILGTTLSTPITLCAPVVPSWERQIRVASP